MSDTGLLPGYLIVGSDELKSSHAVERMRSRLEKTGMAEFNLDERDMAKDPQIDDIIASLNTFPMGAEFRLVILTNCDKLPKAVSEPLVEYFSNPSPTTVCLVVATSPLQGDQEARRQGDHRMRSQKDVGDAAAGGQDGRGARQVDGHSRRRGPGGALG